MFTIIIIVHLIHKFNFPKYLVWNASKTKYYKNIKVKLLNITKINKCSSHMSFIAILFYFKHICELLCEEDFSGTKGIASYCRPFCDHAYLPMLGCESS